MKCFPKTIHDNSYLSYSYPWKSLKCFNLKGCQLASFSLAVANSDIFSWVWLVRIKQLWRICTLFSLSGRGRERLFTEGGGQVWCRVWLKRKERTVSCLSSFPNPPAARDSSPATAVVLAQAESPGGSMAQRWQEVLPPLAGPLGCGPAARPLLPEAPPLWPHPNGSEASIAVWEGRLATLLDDLQQFRDTGQVSSLADYQILEGTRDTFVLFFLKGEISSPSYYNCVGNK